LLLVACLLVPGGYAGDEASLETAWP
jgi:hypothetical protein